MLFYILYLYKKHMIYFLITIFLLLFFNNTFIHIHTCNLLSVLFLSVTLGFNLTLFLLLLCNNFLNIPIIIPIILEIITILYLVTKMSILYYNREYKHIYKLVNYGNRLLDLHPKIDKNIKDIFNSKDGIIEKLILIRAYSKLYRKITRRNKFMTIQNKFMKYFLF